MSTALLFEKLREKAIKHIWNWENLKKRPLWARLVVPVALALTTTWLIIGPLHFFGTYAPFLTYFGVIFFSACFGGSRSAFIAAIASAICVIYFISPMHRNNGESTFNLLSGFFLLEGLAVATLFAIIEFIQQRCVSSEETFRGIIEKNAEGFLMADEYGKINYVCSSIKEILGYDKTDILGKELTGLIHPEEVKSFQLRFLKILYKPGCSMTFLQRLKTKDGEWKWIEGCVNNMLKDVNIKRIVFNYRNVTDRINETKQQEDFVHMAAHELKTPITALRGYLQLMGLNHQKEKRNIDKNMLDRMERQTDRLLNLIDEMLNVTRIRAGELQYHFSVFDLNECIQDVVDSLQATTQSHHINLCTTYLPYIRGDRDRIAQVLTNLISNAIKYAPDSFDIQVNVQADDDHILIKVKDQGIGIPKEQQQKIFERFYRSDSLPKNTYQGLGLGLYIAMDIVKKHGGRMGVESEVGKGSEFWFSLPVDSKIKKPVNDGQDRL